jgi:hypothetical protein
MKRDIAGRLGGLVMMLLGATLVGVPLLSLDKRKENRAEAQAKINPRIPEIEAELSEMHTETLGNVLSDEETTAHYRDLVNELESYDAEEHHDAQEFLNSSTPFNNFNNIYFPLLVGGGLMLYSGLIYRGAKLVGDADTEYEPPNEYGCRW